MKTLQNKEYSKRVLTWRSGLITLHKRVFILLVILLVYEYVVGKIY